MAADLNRCEFIGRLGKDVEMRYTQAGVAIASFSIGVNESYKSKTGEMVKNVEWVNVTAFNKLAEICGKFLVKGSRVYIAGKFKTEKYQAKDGTEKSATKIMLTDMQMLGGDKPQEAAESEATEDFVNDEIPF